VSTKSTKNDNGQMVNNMNIGLVSSSKISNNDNVLEAISNDEIVNNSNVLNPI
jgi:hypothetical protein